MNSMLKMASITLGTVLLGLYFAASVNASLIVADNADAGVLFVEADGTFGIVDAGSETAHVGNRSTASQLRVIVFPFELPALGVGEFFDPDETTFSIQLLGRDFGTAFGVDFYGLRYASTSTVTTNDYAPAGATLLQETLFDSSASNGTRISTDATGSANLATWLGAQYAAGAEAGDYVFLQLRADGDVATDAFNSYQIGMANNTDADLRPYLEVSIIPEPGTLGLLGISLLAFWGYTRRTRG
jgi:hypothetical protein